MTETARRVSQVAARLGVSPHSLRAWEKRYQLPSPQRSAGGYRQYDDRDIRRLEFMVELIADGTPTHEAARLALDQVPARGESGPDRSSSYAEAVELRRRAFNAITELDEAGVRAAFAEAAQLDLDVAVSDVLLASVGGLATKDDVPETSFTGLTAAHAHFGSHLARVHLADLLREHAPDAGPRLWLACPPRELHDVGLLGFGVLAAQAGWRIRFFGGNTPVRALGELARRHRPDALVLSVTRPVVVRRCASELRALAAATPTALGGPGARRALALQLGAHQLANDVVASARQLAAVIAEPVPR